MFDLNECINKWRVGLAQSQSLGKTDIDELESHLRTEIENLKPFQLSDEERFWIAAHRLGNPDRLSDEYAKINRRNVFRQKVSWMIAGILFYLAATFLAKIVSVGSVQLAISRGIKGYGGLGFIGFITQILASAVTVFLSYLIWWLIRKIPVMKRTIDQLTKRISLLMILLVILSTVFFYGVFLHIPVPAFRNMSVQNLTAVALTYTQILWSVLLPVILVMALMILSKLSKREMESP